MYSSLQKYILAGCYRRREKVNRKLFGSFYEPQSAVKKDLQVKIITKSLERLIDRGLLVGYGMRTPCKWFITDVRLTSLGRKKWEEWLESRQAKLPF